jgi:hypothetical protein
LANNTIPTLPAAISLNGTEQLWAVQAGSDVRITTAQLAAYAFGGIFNSLFAEQLTVTGTNTLSNLTNTPTGIFIELIVNAATYLPTGSAPAFSVSGNTVTWNATNAGFSLLTSGFTVIAIYTYVV